MHVSCKDSRLNNRIKKLIMDKHIKQKKKKALKRKLRLSETAIDKGKKEISQFMSTCLSAGECFSKLNSCRFKLKVCEMLGF